MSKAKFTRSFSSLAEFADQFGTAYVAAATPPGVAAERIHSAPPAKVTVVSNEDRERAAKKKVAKMLRRELGGKRAVSKSSSRRVTKVM